MKVLQVIDNLALGGAEVLLTQLHPRFRERGIDCEYYLLQPDNGVLEQKLRFQGAQIHTPLQSSVRSPLHIGALRSHLRRFAYDIVHVHLFPAQLWASLAVRNTPAASALVTTEHSTSNGRRKNWLRALDRQIYAPYKRIVCISAAVSASLVQWLPQLSDRVTVITNGIDIDAFASAAPLDKAAAFGVPEGTPVVLSVGRLSPIKDHMTMLRAMSLVPELHLAIVGSGSLDAKLRALARDLGVSQRVHFLGRRMDVPQLLRAADIYVQSSLWEGFGIAALEAMASGLPVVASQVPGLADVVADAGLLFPSQNPERLAECLRLLLHDSELRKRLSHAAQERAKQYSIDRTRDCYEQLYREMLAKGAAFRERTKPQEKYPE